jgi:hypothetical protein
VYEAKYAFGWMAWRRVGSAGDVIQGDPGPAPRVGSLAVVGRGTDNRAYLFNAG